MLKSHNARLLLRYTADYSRWPSHLKWIFLTIRKACLRGNQLSEVMNFFILQLISFTFSLEVTVKLKWISFFFFSCFRWNEWVPNDPVTLIEVRGLCGVIKGWLMMCVVYGLMDTMGWWVGDVEDSVWGDLNNVWGNDWDGILNNRVSIIVVVDLHLLCVWWFCVVCVVCSVIQSYSAYEGIGVILPFLHKTI
jgi:hypothetical protein